PEVARIETQAFFAPFEGIYSVMNRIIPSYRGRHNTASGGCDCQRGQQFFAGRRRSGWRDPPNCWAGLLAECRLLGGCKSGEAKATKGHNLPAKYVVHTVGPVWREDHDDDRQLASCYGKSLRVATG